MKRVTVVALALAILSAFSVSAQQRRAAAPKAATPRVERAVPFHVGETLTYDVSWSSFVTAGMAVTTVREKKPSFNSTAYYIVAEGRPTPLVAKLYPLYYKMDTLLDSYTLLPQRGAVYSEEGSRHRLKVTRFDRAAGKVSFEYQTATTVKSDFTASPVVQDALSAIYLWRTIPMAAGDRITMPVSDSGKTYKVQMDVGKPEQVRTPLGEMRAVRLKPSVFDASGQPVGRNMAIWISDDARRLPIKFQAELPIGSFVLVLRDAR